MIDFTSPGGPWVHEIDQSPLNQRLASFESVEGVITRFDGRSGCLRSSTSRSSSTRTRC